MTDETPSRPDERRVLDELERLQQAIRTSRSERERAQAEFATYVEAFRPGDPVQQPATPATLEQYQSEPPASAPAHEAPGRPAGPWESYFAEERARASSRSEPTDRADAVVSLRPHVRPPVPEPSPPPAEETSSGTAAEDPVAELMKRLRSQSDSTAPDAAAPLSSTLPADTDTASGSVFKYVIVLVAVLAVGAIVWWSMLPDGHAVDGGNATEATSAPPPQVPSAAEPEAPAGPAPAAEPPPPAAPLQVVVKTTRHVWLRLIVDGDLRLEKEVPAGERYPIGAQQTVVVRAGDAGAVTVEVDGASAEPLGADGRVLTRRFERQPRPR